MTGYPLTAVCETEYRVMRMAMASRQEETRRDRGKPQGRSPLPVRRNRDHSPIRTGDLRGRTPPRREWSTARAEPTP